MRERHLDGALLDNFFGEKKREKEGKRRGKGLIKQ